MALMQRTGPQLGFIGLGAMGSRMAFRLMARDFGLLVYDRRPEQMRLLEENGAVAAPSPRHLAAHTDVVLTSLPDDHAVEAAMFGPDGALAGARAGTIFIDLSTVSLALDRRLHETARLSRLERLDAPVSGSTPQVEQGELVVLIGGDELVYQRCLPIFQVLGHAAYYMGPSGSGTATKLSLNALLGVTMQGLAEAITLGLRSGISSDLLFRILEQSALLPANLKTTLHHMMAGEFPATFPLRLMHKDFGLIIRHALDLGVAMPATAAAAQICSIELERQGEPGEDDFSAIIRTVQEMTLPELIAEPGLSVEWPR